MTNTVTISVEAYDTMQDTISQVIANSEALEGELSLAYDTIDRLNRQCIELEDLYAEAIDGLSGKDERIKTLVNNFATAARDLADAHAKNDVLEVVVELCINSDWSL